jgi:large subunit ribosomal protein L17
MRHRVAGRKFSRHTQHRELMFRNMLVSLVQHDRIRTTLAKGKELRSWADKMITLAKKDTLHARRQAFALLRDRDAVQKLFNEIAPRLKDRQGGYTRIYKMGWRQGDAAPLSLVELVTFSTPEQKKKSTVKKTKETGEKAASKKEEKGKAPKKKAAGKEAAGKDAKEKKVKKENKAAEKEKPKKKPPKEKKEE